MTHYNIPSEIRSLPQWVCTKGDSKIPMMATTNSPASSVNNTTWSTFEDAVKSIEDGRYDWLGFVFADNGIIGIDIDTGYDDGLPSDIACDIIGACKSYTEKSKSGRGFHILIKGELPFKGKNNLNGVEIYKQSRFFVMTGDTLIYDTIVENQPAIDYIIDKYFKQFREDDGDGYGDTLYQPEWESYDGTSPISLRPKYPTIPDGRRNISLTSLAGTLHTVGYTPSQILEELDHCNKVACKPPLPSRDIYNIVNSITRYKR